MRATWQAKKLEAAYGTALEAKLKLAARMIHDLDAKQPGLKQFLKSHGVGDNSIVAGIVDTAERWEIRNRR